MYIRNTTYAGFVTQEPVLQLARALCTVAHVNLHPDTVDNTQQTPNRGIAASSLVELYSCFLLSLVYGGAPRSAYTPSFRLRRLQFVRICASTAVMPRKFQVPAAVRKGLAQFVRKLIELIENSPQDTITWTRGGTAFLVLDPKRFSKRDLGQWFRSSQFNSFVRQLNFYNFTKVPQSKHNWEFTHPHLQRGDWASLSLIKRKTSNEFHAVHDQQVKALRQQVGGLTSELSDVKQQLAAALAQVASLKRERDAAVAKSTEVLRAARGAGVPLKTPPTTTHAFEKVPMLVHHHRSRKRRRTTAPQTTLMKKGVDELPAVPSSPPRADVPELLLEDMSSDMFTLPGDPCFLSDLFTTTPSGVVAPKGSVVSGDDGLCGSADDSWLDYGASISKPPGLVRGFSGMSIGSTASSDAYNAFAGACATDAAVPTSA